APASARRAINPGTVHAVRKVTAPPTSRHACASARQRITWPVPMRASASARTSRFSRRSVKGEVLGQQPKEDMVDRPSVHDESTPDQPFLGESDILERSDATDIWGIHTGDQFAQVQSPEREATDQPDRLRRVPLAPAALIPDQEADVGVAMDPVHRTEFDVPDVPFTLI